MADKYHTAAHSFPPAVQWGRKLEDKGAKTGGLRSVCHNG